jgi:hypothetical protein
MGGNFVRAFGPITWGLWGRDVLVIESITTYSLFRRAHAARVGAIAATWWVWGPIHASLIAASHPAEDKIKLRDSMLVLVARNSMTWLSYLGRCHAPKCHVGLVCLASGSGRVVVLEETG